MAYSSRLSAGNLIVIDSLAGVLGKEASVSSQLNRAASQKHLRLTERVPTYPAGHG